MNRIRFNMKKENSNKKIQLNIDGINEECTQILLDWLEDDVRYDKKIIFQIESALVDEAGEHYWWGNMYYASFGKEYSIIKSNFYDICDKRICEISTELLLEIVKKWFEIHGNTK